MILDLHGSSGRKEKAPGRTPHSREQTARGRSGSNSLLPQAICGSSIHIPKTPFSEQSGRHPRMVWIRPHKLKGRKEKDLTVLRAAGSKPRRDDQELIPILLYANCGSSIHIPKTHISKQSVRHSRRVRIRSHKPTSRKKAPGRTPHSREQTARERSGPYFAPAASKLREQYLYSKTDILWVSV